MVEQIQQPEQISWIGNQIGDVFIEELLGSGQFAWTYQGFNQRRLEKNVVKVAKPPECLRLYDGSDLAVSQAFKLYTGGFSAAIPDAAELLQRQAERMRMDQQQILAKVEQFAANDSLSYLRAEFIEGVTLRELRGHFGPISIDLALDLVRTVGAMQESPVKYHGDLTPVKIMISYSSVRLLDPGYFGSLGCADGVFEHCAVTTPAYYPFLVPDDLFALGIIFWELHFGTNPFASDNNAAATESVRVGDSLKQLAHRYASAGRMLNDALMSFPHPRTLEPDIDAGLEQFLLKSVGLSVNSNDQVDIGDRFGSLAAMGESLSALSAHGLSEI